MEYFYQKNNLSDEPEFLEYYMLEMKRFKNDYQTTFFEYKNGLVYREMLIEEMEIKIYEYNYEFWK